MAKHRPNGPKGNSSGRPKSGQRTLSGARPGGSGPRPKHGGGPHGPKKHGHGPKHGGPKRHDRPAAAVGGGPKRHDRPAAAGGAGPKRHDRPAGEPRPRARAEGSKPDRLQKVLAQAGFGSRRGCEELIVQGRVTINGQVARELGTRVEPGARVAVDGEPIRLETLVYLAVNKPEGYVSTNSDPSGRPRVVDLVAEIPQRVYTVGRLDEDSTGLMLLTNDGNLANRLAHPKYGVEKLYQALVAGSPEPETLSKLTEGVWLSDGKVRAKRVRIAGRRGQATMLELVLAEGKKREIRRMLAKLGHKVMSLNRIAIGPIALKGLAPGESRPLTKHEVELLRKVAAGESLSVPGFPESEHPRPPRGPRKVGQAGAEAGAGPKGDRRRHRDEAEGPPHGRRPGGRPTGPAGAGGRPQRPRPRPDQEEAPPLVQGPRHGTPPRPTGPRRPAQAEGGPPPRPTGPRRHAQDGGPPPRPAGPRRPAEAQGGPPPRPAGPRRPAEAEGGPPPRPEGPRGARPPAGPAATHGPQSRRPPARPGAPASKPPKGDQQEGPRRRIIGLEGPAAEALGGRKRPPSRKPKPPRSALGQRPGRLRAPRPKDGQDGES